MDNPEVIHWENKGPIGQGEIITAILNGKPQEAAKMLHGWTGKDLTTLYWAAETLTLLIREEESRRARLR